MSFLVILNTLNFEFWQIWDLKVAQIIKCQQSQALTSHFESFWSIVAKCNAFRRHYRLLSKGTIEEEAGRISRKSQLQKHDGQGRHAASQ